MAFKLCFLSTVASVFLATQAYALPQEDNKEPDLSCIQRAQWVSPETKEVLNTSSTLFKAAHEKIVLLGEQHPDKVHHRWQLQTIIQLYAYNSNMVLGFEMFPRRFQPILDAWIRGELTEHEFLEKTQWDKTWKFDADMYMPMFQFARMNKIPMIALNVDMSLISKISKVGWNAIDVKEREGVATPRDAHPDYVKSLKEIFSHHSHISDEDKKAEERFNRFVQSQLTWDGAMAQSLAEVQKRGGNPLVVGVMGTGHLANRYGVPHQLEGLGLNSTVLLPWTLGWDCSELTSTYGDAIFGVEEPDPQPKVIDTSYKPVLGVRIKDAENRDGALIEEVVEGSLAEEVGLEKDEIIVQAAGEWVKDAAHLVKIIRRQASGTYLPLVIDHYGLRLEYIAKFPPQD